MKHFLDYGFEMTQKMDVISVVGFVFCDRQRIMLITVSVLPQ